MASSRISRTAFAFIPISVWALAMPVGAQAFHVERLRTEYLENPIGIDAQSPRLSWRLHSARRGTMQSAYEIRVAPDTSALRGVTLWNSGKIPSDESIFRAYGGPVLQSGTRYYWQVRVWDAGGEASPWSTPAFFETGLLKPTDWSAKWITPDLPEDTTRSNPSPMLRHEFAVRGQIATARLYVTSLGLNTVELNGRRVGDHLFSPGWTSYDKRLQYDSYDVTALILQGQANAIGATLGDGWYRGRFGFTGRRNNYGSRLGLLAQLVVRYADGRTQVVATDSTWKSATGAIVKSDIYDGETYDARLERDGWSRPRYDDHSWRGVRLMNGIAAALIAPSGPPVRATQNLKTLKVFRTPAGETVFDLGQNMVGWVRLRVTGPAGATVRMRTAEVLDKAGNVYYDNLRAAAATMQYTLKGGGEETWEPHFTYQGFRYVSVEGLPGTPSPDAITGIVIHSDMETIGRFESSNALVNQLQHNIVWGQRGNFLDVPTDCPQRDERLGWMGDAQVFARTAAFNMDVSGFFAKWTGDIAADQKADGGVPRIIPDIQSRGSAQTKGIAGWSDASVIVPWTMYQAYGDTRLLERQYPSMRAWVEFMRAEAGPSRLWTTGGPYGDWLAFATTDASYPGATTDIDLVATAYFAHSTDLLARSAAALGKTDDASGYRALFAEIAAAFQREYVTSTGRVASNTQTAYVLALDFGLLAEARRPEAARRLAEGVTAMRHLTTGFLGTPALTRTLSQSGHVDVAYALLLNERYPSWLYPVKQGATTIWERWDGQKPDGTFQEKSMNSFNHYAYGAVGDWLYRVVAGLDMDPAQPGYRRLMIVPQPGGGFTFARATLSTPYGDAESGWKLTGDTLQVTARVPANSRATVRLPGALLAQVREGSDAVAVATGVTQARQVGDDVVAEIGSGDYVFTYVSPALADRVRSGGRFRS